MTSFDLGTLRPLLQLMQICIKNPKNSHVRPWNRAKKSISQIDFLQILNNFSPRIILSTSRNLFIKSPYYKIEVIFEPNKS